MLCSITKRTTLSLIFISILLTITSCFSIKRQYISWDEYLSIQLDKPISSITDEDYISIDYISLTSNMDYIIQDLNGIERFKNLRSLTMEKQELTDLKHIAALYKIRALTIVDNNITDLTPLGNLSNLFQLNIEQNFVQSLEPLKNLKNLEVLMAWHNQIEEISPLENLDKIRFIHLSKNKISSLHGIEGKQYIEFADFSENLIKDVTPLSSVTFKRQQFDSTKLTLAYNQIANISPLLSIQGLDELILTGNPLSEKSINEIIPALRAKGMEVIF
jgi:internalin A